MNCSPVPGKDYKVTYSNNKKAGTGKYTITFLGNYKGAPNKSFKNLEFKINKANSSDAKIYVADMIKGSNEKSKQYFAKPDTNMFVAVDEGKMQIKKSDYTVAFSQGDKALTGKGTETIEFTEGVAELTVTVTPKGTNFEGDPITETYKVIDAGSNVAVNKATSKLVAKDGTKVTKVTKPGYTGAVITFEQSDDNRQGDIVINGGKIGGAKANLTAAEVAEYFDVTYVNNVQKGKAYYILTAKDGNDKNYVGSIVGNFTIKAGDIKKSAE